MSGHLAVGRSTIRTAMSGFRARAANCAGAGTRPALAQAGQSGESLLIQMLPTICTAISAPCTTTKAQVGTIGRSIGGAQSTPAEATSTKLMWRRASR
jgi:hypothetical protein